MLCSRFRAFYPQAVYTAAQQQKQSIRRMLQGLDSDDDDDDEANAAALAAAAAAARAAASSAHSHSNSAGNATGSGNSNAAFGPATASASNAASGGSSSSVPLTSSSSSASAAATAAAFATLSTAPGAFFGPAVAPLSSSAFKTRAKHMLRPSHQLLSSLRNSLRSSRLSAQADAAPGAGLAGVGGGGAKGGKADAKGVRPQIELVMYPVPPALFTLRTPDGFRGLGDKHLEAWLTDLTTKRIPQTRIDDLYQTTPPYVPPSTDDTFALYDHLCYALQHALLAYRVLSYQEAWNIIVSLFWFLEAQFQRPRVQALVDNPAAWTIVHHLLHLAGRLWSHRVAPSFYRIIVFVKARLFPSYARYVSRKL